MSLRALSLLAATAGFAVTATAADWPQWRGPGRDGKAADTRLLQAWPKDGPKLLWTVQDVAKVGTGYGSPAVVGDRVYVHGGTAANLKGKGSVTYADGMLYCFSEAGTLALVKATPDGWTEAGRIDIPQKSPIRSKTQGKVWPHPVVANGQLYLRDYEYLYCYDVGQPRQ
jgi:hypothetical protein